MMFVDAYFDKFNCNQNEGGFNYSIGEVMACQIAGL